MDAAARGHRLSLASETRDVALPRRPTSVETAFALACFVGSAATVQKYGGTASMFVYLAVLLGAVPLFLRAAVPRFPQLKSSTIVMVAAASLVVLAVLFFVLYPHANSHVPGVGSDRDDAADMGAHALLRGQWPYHGRTYLGGTISQLPGLLLLAVPFVALGHSAYAAFFWLPVLFALLWNLRAEGRVALLLAWLALIASPVLVREVVTGGDLLANTISVMVAVWLIALALERHHRWRLVFAGLFMGFVLSSRLNFLFVLLPLAAFAWKRYGIRRVLEFLVPTAVSMAAVTLPFWVGRASFPPLTSSDHLSAFDGSLPGGQSLVIAIALVVAIGFALAAPPRLGSVFAQAAAVQAFFIVAVGVHEAVQAGSLDLTDLTPGYGLPVVLLALGALACDGSYFRALEESMPRRVTVANSAPSVGDG